MNICYDDFDLKITIGDHEPILVNTDMIEENVIRQMCGLKPKKEREVMDNDYNFN